jgi:hypothetical protein
MEKRIWNPGDLLALSGSYWQTCALHAGVKLGIFTVLDDGPLTTRQVASACKIDPRAAERLLNALCAMHLLEKTEHGFGPTSEAVTYLSQKSPHYLGYMIMHHHHLMPSWSRLDEAVKSGRPVRERTSLSEDQVRRESFLMGMFNMAMQVAPKVAAHLDLSDCRHLLDLGGGPGTYAIHFCRHNPGLKATVFDLPTTQPFAEKTIGRFQMLDRVAFQAGDFTAEPIPGSYDVVWLSHILHAEGFEMACRIVRKAVSALTRHGLIVIHEFILDDSMDGPLFAALFSLNMLLGTPQGQAYSQSQLSEMMIAAGVSDIRRTDFRGPTDSGIMIGRKA